VSTADALALLVRRTALAIFPRETIAPLSGAAWLDFLDRSYEGHEFSQGAGRTLGLAAQRRDGLAWKNCQRGRLMRHIP
jgi:Domain of unknown function (DUF4381)